MGHPEMVSQISTATRPPSTSTLLTMSSSVIGRRISGSFTLDSAAVIASVDTGAMPRW
jgi:hypothetical protein